MCIFVSAHVCASLILTRASVRLLTPGGSSLGAEGVSQGPRVPESPRGEKVFTAGTLRGPTWHLGATWFAWFSSSQTSSSQNYIGANFIFLLFRILEINGLDKTQTLQANFGLSSSVSILCQVQWSTCFYWSPNAFISGHRDLAPASLTSKIYAFCCRTPTSSALALLGLAFVRQKE